MQIGMIGLGRMGANMVRRLHARRPLRRRLRDRRHGASGSSRSEGAPRRGVARRARREARRRRGRPGSWCRPARRRSRPSPSSPSGLEAGDIDHRRRQLVLQGRRPPRARRSAPKGIHYVDVGTSGGVWGLERGYCLMIGGDARRRCSGSSRSSRRSRRAAATIPRTPGRGGARAAPPRRATSTAARRRRALRQDDPQRHRVRPDAGVRRGLRHPAQRATRRSCPSEQRYDLDLADIAELWRRGSVVSSWLLDLTAHGAGRETRSSPSTPGTCRTRARAAGPSGGDRGGGAGRRARRRRSTPASARARSTPSPRRCCRRCGTSSAATSSAPTGG